MAKILGYFGGTRPYAQMAARQRQARNFGAYEAAGVAEQQYGPYEYGTRHLALAADAPVQVYDLAAPGRVREVQKALRLLAYAGSVPGSDPIVEQRWAWMTIDDDKWQDSAADEFVAFLSRYAPQYMCFQVPLFGTAYGWPQPTTSGLLLLDAVIRYESAGLLQQAASILHSCGYGAPSDIRLDQFEKFLFGSVPSGSVDLDPSSKPPVQTAGTPDVSQKLVPPPDVNAGLYSQWQGYDNATAGLWDSLFRATTEADRKNVMDALVQNRSDRDGVAIDILSQAPGRTGTTTIDCGKDASYDASTGRCVPKLKQASVLPWVAGGAAALLLGGLALAGKPKGGR